MASFFMRIIALLALLMPVAANAASFSKADCEFVYLCFEGCAAEQYNCIRTGSEAHRAHDFMARHPSLLDKQILQMCEKIHSGALSKEVAFHKFCKTKPTLEQ
jgi:hypothetical protein